MSKATIGLSLNYIRDWGLATGEYERFLNAMWKKNYFPSNFTKSITRHFCTELAKGS